MSEAVRSQLDLNFVKYINLLKTINRDGMDNLIAWLESKDTKIAPASTKYHLAVPGGLIIHSLNVYECLQKLIKTVYPENSPYSEETVILVALLHDIAKVNFYDIQERNTKDEKGNWIKVPYYAVKDERERLTFGSHPLNSYYMVSKFIKLNYEEELAILHHEGAFDTGMNPIELSTVMAAFKKSPLALLLHQADMQATCLLEGEDE